MKSPLRICFVLPYAISEASGGGVSKVVQDLSGKLKEQGHQIEIIDKDIIMEAQEGKKNKFSLYFNLMKLIIKKRRQIDVLHLHTAFPTSTIAAFTGKVLGIPSVTTTHGPFVPGDRGLRVRIYLLLEKVTFKVSNVTTFVSNESKEFYDIDGPVIYNGMDLKRYIKNENLRTQTRKKHRLNGEFVVLFAGRIVKEKGIYILLNAFSKIDTIIRKNTKLMIVGLLPRDEGDFFKERIRELGISDYVIYLGLVDDVYPYYCASDLFCFPSIYRGEGLPMSLLEAMATSLPSIASSIGGVKNLVRDGVNGLLIEMGSEESLKEKLEWCIKNSDTLADIGGQARVTIENDYDLEKITDKYIELYNEIIDNRKN